MRVNLVVAHDVDRGIGKNGSIPWRCHADVLAFRGLTTSGLTNAVIMGRATWESLPKALPGRLNIVVTGNYEKYTTDETFVPTLDEAIRLCKIEGIDEVWICGGERIYEESLQATGDLQPARCFVTEVEGNWDCDRFFPRMPPAWSITEIRRLDAIATMRIYEIP